MSPSTFPLVHQLQRMSTSHYLNSEKSICKSWSLVPLRFQPDMVVYFLSGGSILQSTHTVISQITEFCSTIVNLTDDTYLLAATGKIM